MHQQTLNIQHITSRENTIDVYYNEAISCYDRIVLVVIFLALRRLGIPKPMIDSVFCTIQILEHSIQIQMSDLSKIKNVRTLRQGVTYGPMIYLQCMRFKNEYGLIGDSRLTLMIELYDTDTDLGNLLQASLEYVSMELGSTQLPFHYDYEYYSRTTTHVWMKNL